MDGCGRCAGLSVAACDARVDAVLGWDSEVVAEGGTLVASGVDASLLQQGDNPIHKGLDAVFVDVG